MRLESPGLYKMAALLGTAGVRWWMDTLQYKAALYDPSLDPAKPDCRGQKIYLFWHEYILFPFFLRGHCNLAMLLSRHRDAEVLSHAAYYMGFDVVRGSTNRGGVAALRQMLRKSRHMHLTITPDGPRGPRRKLALGPVFLASRLGMPLVLMGIGADRPWRVARAWDRFVIPRPFSRARIVLSPEVHVPADLDRGGLEHFRLRVEGLLSRLTLEAESWAAAGTPKVGQVVVNRQAAPPRRRAESPSPTGTLSPRLFRAA